MKFVLASWGSRGDVECLAAVGRELMRHHLKHCATSAIRTGGPDGEAMYDELMELRRRGERTYYEFKLHKGDAAQNVGTIKLALKKVDQKKSKFTLAVNSDDKNIEKKDKNLDEPVQFYSGKNPALFEIVVNNISKNQVQGYLSTPKNVPGPISVQ